MDVFLVPVGDQRYALYCEVVDASDAAATAQGVRQRLKGWFHRLIATAAEERRRHDRPPRVVPVAPQAQQPFRARIRSKLLHWIADAVAQQHVLWHLRKQSEAVLVHPDDLPPEEAIDRVRALLQRSAERYGAWLVVDALLFVVSGLFVIVPGPNLIAYFFLFRVIGHSNAWRGARKGVRAVTWNGRANRPLAELRHAVGLSPAERWERASAIAGSLQLQHLAAFFERTVKSSS